MWQWVTGESHIKYSGTPGRNNEKGKHTQEDRRTLTADMIKKETEDREGNTEKREGRNEPHL